MTSGSFRRAVSIAMRRFQAVVAQASPTATIPVQRDRVGRETSTEPVPQLAGLGHTMNEHRGHIDTFTERLSPCSIGSLRVSARTVNTWYDEASSALFAT